jgi:hypothetical protein
MNGPKQQNAHFGKLVGEPATIGLKLLQRPPLLRHYAAK